MKIKIAVLGFTVAFIAACKKENVTIGTQNGDYSESPWILNEGSFLSGNAAVDVVYGDGSKISNIFQEVNGQALGDVLQSGLRLDSRAYLVLNGSEKIQVVNSTNFTNLGVIEGIAYPRYIHSTGNGKLYLTSGSLAGYVTVLDEDNYNTLATVPVGFGPEKMCSFSDNLFVCNSGGWTEDNTLSIINTSSDVEVERIDLGDRPIDCECDANGNLWVLCSGSVYYDESWNITGHSMASIYKLNAITFEVLESQQVGEEGDHPEQIELSANGEYLFINLNNIKRTETGSFPLVLQDFINGEFNALNVDHRDNSIWLSSYLDFVAPGIVYKYNDSGYLVNSWNAGIGPNSIIFPH